MPTSLPENDAARGRQRGALAWRIGRDVLMVLAILAILLLGAWTAVALWFQAPGGALVRVLLILVWVAFGGALLLGLHRGHGPLALLCFAAAFGIVLVWWHTLRPSNERLWSDDVAQMAAGVAHGDQVTISNVRNFDWRSADDYTVRWET